MYLTQYLADIKGLIKFVSGLIIQRQGGSELLLSLHPRDFVN